MTQLGFIVLAALGGSLAGVIFFGGLWWTVQRINYARHPFMLVIGSLLFRLALALIIFYAITAITEHILYLGLALVVFLIVRVFITGQVKGHQHAVES